MCIQPPHHLIVRTGLVQTCVHAQTDSNRTNSKHVHWTRFTEVQLTVLHVCCPVCPRGAKMGTDVNAYATSKLYMLMYGAELNKRWWGGGGEE